MLRAGTMWLPLMFVAQCAAAGDEIPFCVHMLNPAAEFSAAAAFDVDHDGDLDVISGGFWYEAPDWMQHVALDVLQP
jgi:hypothetical protein